MGEVSLSNILEAMLVTGPFSVSMAPVSTAFEGEAYARMSLDKTYQGELEATGKGEMLSAGDPTQGSAGYVAVETVTGILQGKAGSFALMHWGTMSSGAFDLKVKIVPGSGTGELVGLKGSMEISRDADGGHIYRLDFNVAN